VLTKGGEQGRERVDTKRQKAWSAGNFFPVKNIRGSGGKGGKKQAWEMEEGGVHLGGGHQGSDNIRGSTNEGSAHMRGEKKKKRGEKATRQD